jgi:hypothetical protein
MSDAASESEVAERLARRYLWWKAPKDAVRERQALLCQILKLGTAEDYVLARDLFGEQAFKDALLRAEPGAIDERSWAFWHRHYRLPMRPYPRRSFP